MATWFSGFDVWGFSWWICGMEEDLGKDEKAKLWIADFEAEPVPRVVNPADFDRLCETAVRGGADGRPFENAGQFVDYIKLMAYSGAREQETLELKWTDVDWERRQLIVGSDRAKKNLKPRRVDFNAKMEAHLKDMQSRKAADAVWLFPSPHGSKMRVDDFDGTMRRVREAAGFPQFEYVDLAHYFKNYCLTLGIPTMTIVGWMLDRYD